MTPAFAPDQPVNINFNGVEPFTLIGRVIENIDASCRPLTNMWSVEITGDGPGKGARFGISGEALVPRNTAT